MGGMHDPRWDQIDGPADSPTALPRVTYVQSAGHWRSDWRVGFISLTFDQRHRRRIRLSTDDGTLFLLDLATAHAMNHGDGLTLENGNIIEVIAAPEALLEVRANDPTHMIQLAWHIGNRHLPAMIKSNVIYIRSDHVIRSMLTGLSAEVNDITGPFQPLGGAYSSSGTDSHDHSFK